MDCSVLKKEPLGKELMLNLQSKGHPAHLPSAQGTPGSARKSLPRLKLRSRRNLLVRLWVRSLMVHSFGFSLSLKPNFSFNDLCLGQVLTKPKSKKWTEVRGQGLPLDPEAGFEFFVGFGSTSGLQQLKVMTTVDMGGELSAPANSELSKGAEEFSFPPEGASSCLNTSLVADLSISEGFAN
jgi:hypothetical protein